MTYQEVSMTHIAVIGCGTIGISWAAYFLSHGLKVSAFDPDETVRASFSDLVAADMATLGVDPRQPQVCETLADTVEQAELVVENAPESAELKRELLAEIQRLAPDSALVVSSTSSLKHSDIALGAPASSRIAIAHPFNPPHLVPLVELYGTDPDVVENLIAFYRGIGKQPVVMRKEMVGHIANRLSSALWREALYLLQEGVASVEDIDKAVTAGPGMRWAIQGPFLTYHLGGGQGGIKHYLEHLGPSQQYRWSSLGVPVMDEALKTRIVDGVDQATQGQSLAELFANRDSQLVILQQSMGVATGTREVKA
ncbi:MULTISPECIES: 3-hydroxyacyl-CoA dehydrogenase NAD-binding domain-containing protein [Halomonadaceae]|uniref:3-hydroxyacyl-CoA dehydrogenase NAD-binding domain-containing protein n=1 Tax=Halomonadaceae TaxID=28256 RepID=UPI001C2538BF|nr:MULTISPECIES: 3-hydroxyacyl-CoA dehydrogenase NAD-binding domain-containing protein [Halomonas]